MHKEIRILISRTISPKERKIVLNILTEREFLTETDTALTQINNWIENGVMRPIKMFNDKMVFFRKHVRLVENIKQLESQGLSLEQITPHVSNETVDVDIVLNSQNVLTRTLPYFQSLSYEEIIARCQSERIVGFRRMSREQMEICLAYPEQREEIVETVRESNRRRTRSTRTTENAPTPTISVIAENSAVLGLSYKDLVQMAKDARIPNFRRMSKDELIICFTASEEVVSQLIADVRERTKNRYGNASAVSQPQSLARMNAFDDESISQLLEEEQEFLSEQPFYEEDVISEDDEVFAVSAPETELPEFDDIEVDVDEEDEEEVVIFEEASSEEVPVVEAPPVVSPETVLPEQTTVPFTLEELQAMNSKQVAVVVRDYLDIKYFRRMTKEELIICIFDPSRREEMVEIAAARYELYRGRRYGQNART